MDKELKELMKTICSDCPYSVPQRDPCEHIHCRQREAFNKVKAAYENVEKDLASRQKKNKQKNIESLSFDTTGLCEGQVD